MNMMKSSVSATCIWTMFYLSVIYGENFIHGEINYDRIDQVNKQCQFLLDSATELQRDDNRLYTIKNELSFENGDWWQDLNAVPLMPFDDSQIPDTDTRSPSKLVSFGVTDVNSRYRSNKAIYVSSFMRIGISLWNLFSAKSKGEKPQFTIRPNYSQLSVSFQGIYTESEENDGERVMCLLGTTFWPSIQLHSSLESDEPLLAKDDQILLVLRFPRKFTLRSRTIRGTMKSMNRNSNVRYFDEVHISSWLSNAVNYEFKSETLVSKACETYPFKDSFVNGNIDLYKGVNFCVLLKRFTKTEAFAILPNWKCNGTVDYCKKIGPFVLDKEIHTRDFKLLLQDVRCDKMTFHDDNGIGTMKIHLVLRAIPPYEDEFAAVRRNGLSNLTIFAEGIWKSSSGQLCMIGCKGDDNSCDTRICLYLPLSFSLNQQTLILGTLSSTDHASTSHFNTLPFERQVRTINSQAMFWDQYIPPRPTYEYTKIDDARVVLEKDKPFSLGNTMKKSLLGFPKIMDLQQFPYSLSHLANDLAFPISFVSESDVALEINFLGPLFGRSFSRQSISVFAKENQNYFDMDRYTDKHLLLNVSGQLNNVPNPHTKLSFLSVEGIYDPLVGKMYLIGCQDSLDCSVEVVISYPPTTARWLFKQKAWISLTSKREKDDPFYFHPTKFETGSLEYNQGRETTLSRRGFEGILSILLLSLGIYCILIQLSYIRESAPYVSLVMLGVQALGYSLPLITGARVIFRNVERESYYLQTSQWICTSDYITKLLVLAAFLLTMRLFHMVWKSRVRMVRRTSLEPDHVPNEKNVCLSTIVMHIVGCILYLSVHIAKSTSESPQSAPTYEPGTESHSILRLVDKMEEYLVLVQDLFLVPQIIANLLWKIDCKPLRRFYYVGMTFVRLFPHIYYLLKPGYFPEPHALFRPQFDFFPMFEDIAMTVTVVFLGLVVYVQQRWSYATLSEAFTGVDSKFKSG